MAKKKATQKKAKATAKKVGKKPKATLKAASKKTMGKSKSSKAATKKAATKKTTTKKALKKATAKSAAPKAAAKKPLTLAKMSGSTKSLVGQPAPRFNVPATGGRTVSLEELKGRNVVLFFYPKDATPGCTIEGHEFTKLHPEFQTLNTEVFGISRDDINSHEKFKADECYTIDLLSDTDSELCNAFEVIKKKNMYGREVMGIERSTFVIDGDGNIIKEFRGVNAPGHAAEVLEFLKSRNG